MTKTRFKIPRSKNAKYESFITRNGTLDSYFLPAVFCDTSFLLDYWTSDKHQDSPYKLPSLSEKVNKPLKNELGKYFDPDRRTRKLFELRKIIDKDNTGFNFVYTPACRFELEEIMTSINFKSFITENYEINAIERMSRKEIGNVARKIRTDLLKDNFELNPRLNDLFFSFFQSTSYIRDGLPGFYEVDIGNFRFSKNDFLTLYFFANQQMGFADLFHLISAKNLGCKYLFTFDSDFEQNKKEIKRIFDISVFSNIDEMIGLIEK